MGTSRVGGRRAAGRSGGCRRRRILPPCRPAPRAAGLEAGCGAAVRPSGQRRRRRCAARAPGVCIGTPPGAGAYTCAARRLPAHLRAPCPQAPSQSRHACWPPDGIARLRAGAACKVCKNAARHALAFVRAIAPLPLRGLRGWARIRSTPRCPTISSRQTLGIPTVFGIASVTYRYWAVCLYTCAPGTAADEF